MKTLCFALLMLSLAAAATGCARPIEVGAIPVESRPNLASPEASGRDTTTVPAEPGLMPEQQEDMSPVVLESLRARVELDTLTAHNAVQRCAGRNLLPDQEASRDATVSLLMRTHAALLKDDLRSAESLARQARQMSDTIGCP